MYLQLFITEIKSITWTDFIRKDSNIKRKIRQTGLGKTYHSEVETFPAPTATLLVGVYEHKLTAQFIVLEGHLSADQSQDRSAVDHHFDSFGLDHLVKSVDLGLTDIVHVVAEARTTFLGQGDLDSNLC